MSEILHPYFRLSGQFDADEITERLGIEPRWVSRIGDPGPSGAVGPRLGAEWVWQPEDDDSDHVGDQLAFMAGALSHKQDVVSELSKAFAGEFIVYEQFVRDWFISADTIRIISNFSVDVTCVNAPYVEPKDTKYVN